MQIIFYFARIYLFMNNHSIVPFSCMSIRGLQMINWWISIICLTDAAVLQDAEGSVRFLQYNASAPASHNRWDFRTPPQFAGPNSTGSCTRDQQA